MLFSDKVTIKLVNTEVENQIESTANRPHKKLFKVIQDICILLSFGVKRSARLSRIFAQHQIATVNSSDSLSVKGGP